jgi:hypothetical protein
VTDTLTIYAYKSDLPTLREAIATASRELEVAVNGVTETRRRWRTEVVISVTGTEDRVKGFRSCFKGSGGGGDWLSGLFS